MNKCPFCQLLHDPEKTHCNDPHTGALIRRAGPITELPPPGMTKIPPVPLTRIELDVMIAGGICNKPGCKCGGHKPSVRVELLPRCHPDSGVKLSYSCGIVDVICTECGIGVHRIQVAKSL